MATITMYNSINIDDAFSPLQMAVATGGTTGNSVTDPPTTWTARTLPSSSSQNSVCYGRSMLVAVAGGGTAAGSSPDGVTQTSRTLPASATQQSVIWGGDRFVAIANGSTNTAYSLDGITWTAGGALPSSAQQYCVAYCNGIFVAVATNATTAAAYSNNGGVTQYSATLPASDNQRSVCTDGTKFLAVGYGATNSAISTDGTTWASGGALPSSANQSSVCYGNGQFVAVAYNTNKGATSPDGTTQTARTLSATANQNCISYGISSVQGYKMYCATAYGTNAITYSYDGITQIADTLATNTNWTYHCFAPITQNSADTLVVQNDATISVNTHQEKFQKTITGTFGKLKITNDTTLPIGFYMGRASASTANDISPGSGLFDIEIDGDWIQIGTGTDTSGQTFDTSYTEYVPAIQVETDASTDIYEIWLNITGAFGPYMKIFGKDGLEWAGEGNLGNYFEQLPATNPIEIKSLTSGATTIQSRWVTCASTTGVFPGASITGTNIPTNTVVNRVLDTTTLELNVVCTATGTGYTFTVYNPIQAQLTSTIRVGNGINGNKVKTGAKVKIPNIIISDKTPANVKTASNLVDAYINMSTGAPISAKQCLFGDVYCNFAQAASLYLRDVGFAYKFALSECYAVDMTGVGTAATPTYWYYGTRQVCRDQRYSTVVPYGYTVPTAGCNIAISYIHGAKIKNQHNVVYSSMYFTGTSGVQAIDIGYSNDMVLDDLKFVYLFPSRVSYSLFLSNRCYNNTITNLKLYGAVPLYISTSDFNTIQNVEYSMAVEKVQRAFLTTHRICADPNLNQTPLGDNTAYFFKTRTFFATIDRTYFFESNEYSATAFEAGQCFPDYFSVRPTESAANSVTLDWVRRAPESATLLYEIFRSTTKGFTDRNNANRIWGSATAATITYADTGVTAGTRYYYRFRKYSTLNTKAGCSAASGATVLTTSGTFASISTITDCYFDNSSTIIRNIVNNFYASILYPGCKITGTGIDTDTTVVSINPSGREVIISKPTTSAQNLITITIPVQVGMGLNGTSIQYGTIVTEYVSDTTINISNTTTGVISSATINFQTFTESAEFTVVPNAYKTATNLCLQSRVLGTTQTTSNITISGNTYAAPTESAWATNSGSADTLTASAGNGTLTQSVGGLTIGNYYTASAQIRADQVATIPNGVSGSIAFGGTTNSFTAINEWKLVSATFLATATSHNFVVTITTNGQAIQMTDAVVTLGTTPIQHINTTTTATTLSPCALPITTLYAFCRNREATGITEINKNQGIQVTIGTAPTGSYYHEIYMSTEPGFVATDVPVYAQSTTSSLLTTKAALSGCGITSAALAFGGLTASEIANTDKQSGSSQVTTTAMNAARSYLSGCGTTSAALSFGGWSGATMSNTEIWSGSSQATTPALNSNVAYNAGCGTTSGALSMGGQTGAGITGTEKQSGTAWATTTAMNVGNYSMGCCGDSGNALLFNGIKTEKQSGSAQTTTTSTAFSRTYVGGAGTTSSALCFGGYTGSYYFVSSEIYNGSVQATTSSINVARGLSGSCGTSSDSLSFGGFGGSNVATTEINKYQAPNKVASTFAVDGGHIQFTGSNYNTISDVTHIQQYGGGAAANTGGCGVIYMTANSIYNIVKNVSHNAMYCNTIAYPVIYLYTAAHNNVIHNIDLGRIKNYISGAGIVYTASTNATKDNRLQHIKCVNSDIPISNQMLNTYVKGINSAQAFPATTATTYALGSTSDGIATAYTAAYGSMFYELYFSKTDGALHLVFEDTQGDSKPYTILSGSPIFNNVGRLFMTQSGDSIEITQPQKIVGVSGFKSLYPKILTTDLGNTTDFPDVLKIEYKIDSGSGYPEVYVQTTTSSLNTTIGLNAGCGTTSSALSFGGENGGGVSTYNEKQGGSSWAITAAMNLQRYRLAGCGTTSAALSFGGTTAGALANTEIQSGSSWATTTSLNNGIMENSGCGTTSAALSLGGYTGAYVSASEIWNGTIQSITASMNVNKERAAACGSTSSALSFGGQSGVSRYTTTEIQNGTVQATTTSMNLARMFLSGCGITSSALAFSGLDSAYIVIPEQQNGLLWTTTSSMNVPKQRSAGCGTASSALSFGGYHNEYLSSTEKWLENSGYKRLTPQNISSESISPTNGFFLNFRLTTSYFMKYGAQTNPFVVGERIRGASSGAKCIILENWDNGGTGTIVVCDIVGSFIPAESLVRDSDSQARAPNVATNGFALGPSYTSSIYGIQIFTNIDQSVQYPVTTPTITLIGLQPNSEVRILRQSDLYEMAGIENSTTEFSAQYDYYEDTEVYIVVHSLGYQYIRLPYTLTAQDASIPIQQQIDRTYSNPA